MTEYLTVPEVARHLRVSEDSVRRYIRRGRLRAHRVGGNVRIRRQDMEDFVEPAGPLSEGRPDSEHRDTGDSDWFLANLDRLQEQHPGRYLAIKDRAVRVAALTVAELLEEIERLDLEEPFITHIPEEPPRWAAVFARH